jgi:hypothetical protein
MRGIERRADIRADDQGKRGVERNDALFREGHHEQRDLRPDDSEISAKEAKAI